MSATERVLYVEDDPDIRAIARMALEVLGGFEVRICASGPEAVAAPTSFAPDIVVLDVMMPRMDGRTTLAELRRVAGLERVPAVFVTAKVEPDDVERYRESGVIGVIKKPFDPLTLADQIRSLAESAGT